ncbi:polysaccharide deacetylase family protein [Rhodomicrobium sp. Az07]|uniref:polysaccharide deacetylase family protein n=1 Tax=Rhodomicrobium sp. Az07 TaxID=2839034 RepID=UPI001BE664F3|nr:polysaccharide deacetylase family protein [Rhodomicrobium sp. Az07]MBT3070855.1 polysaccharide deacetylase family protein [Rhodomicrobium sp. Az07]
MSRIIAADSTQGALYGTALNAPSNRAYARTLNLRDREVVLTFDDGPLGTNTRSVLNTLDKHCVKATFFSVGRMALADPKLLREYDRRGHTVGAHTFSHPFGMDRMAPQDAIAEIEKGFAAVSHALGKPVAPFFRFPGLRDSPEAVAYLASRNISTWSVDVISGDTDPGANAAKVTKDVLARVRGAGKGILLFHDIKKPTAEALDGIITALRKDGYKFVHVVSNTNYQPNPEMVANADAFRARPEKPTSSNARWTAAARAEIRAGSVDVMRTEWVELQQANEQLTGKTRSETSGARGATQMGGAFVATSAGNGQTGGAYMANSWLATGQIQ